jgi:hypothetical protein
MSWWKRFVAIFKSEAADVKEGLTTVGKSLDAELARKEREMAATPEERIQMLLEEQEAEDARFDELTDKVLGKTADAEAVEELAENPATADDPASEHPEGD